MIKVFLIDKNISFKSQLISALSKEKDISIVGEIQNGQNPIHDILKSKPDIILIDIKYQEESWLDLLLQIRKGYPQGNIIVLTNCIDRIYITKAFEAGVRAYLLKEKHIKYIVKYFKKVMNGEKCFPSEIKSIITDFIHNILINEKELALKSLDIIEYEILMLLNKGKNPCEISLSLKVSERTIYNNKKSMMTKLNLRNLIDR
jgi:DNA-binding NarL/FixJ family response regulator